MLDGVYIFDETGKCVLSFAIGGHSPQQLNLAGYIPSALTVSNWSQFIEVTHTQLLYQEKYGRLFLFIPCGTTSPPSLIEQLSNRVIEVVESYFQHPLTPLLINDHRSEIICILSEMLDTGVPRITQPDIIRQLVYKEDFLSKLMGQSLLNQPNPQSAVGAASQGKQTARAGSNLDSRRIPDAVAPWEYPWRRSRVNHAREELFVDVIEHVKIMAKQQPKTSSASSSIVSSGRPLRIQVSGEIKLLSHLSETPHVTIDLHSQGTLFRVNQSQVHPSVNLTKFLETNGRVLEVVPADLDSCIAKYKLVTRQSGPLSIDLRRNIQQKTNDTHGAFQVCVSTAIDTKVEHISGLIVKIAFPPTVKLVKEISTTSGDLDTSDLRNCEYRFAKVVPMGWNASLTAIALDADNNPVNPLYIDARYQFVGRIPSQTLVKSIHITPQKLRSQDAAPYKGVRYQTRVDAYIVS